MKSIRVLSSRQRKLLRETPVSEQCGESTHSIEFIRCGLPRGHRGKHAAEWRHADGLGSIQSTWPISRRLS